MKAEVIPEKYHDLSEVIGVGNLLNIAKTFGGSMIYIPKYDSLTREIRDEKICQEFNGKNYEYLCKKYNLCNSSIKRILSKNKNKELL